MGEKRADALSNSPTLLQAQEALGAKLVEATQGPMPSKQRGAGSNPARDATTTFLLLDFFHCSALHHF